MVFGTVDGMMGFNSDTVSIDTVRIPLDRISTGRSWCRITSHIH